MGDVSTGRRTRLALPLAIVALAALAILLVLWFFAFRHLPPSADTPSGFRAFTGIPPVADFVARLAGPGSDVAVLVGPGREPHTFEPTPKQMAQLSDADVYFTIGLPFENEIARKLSTSLTRLRIVDVSKGVPFLASTEHDEPGEDHGEAHDPHIWLDPIRVKIIARNIADALIEIDLAHKADYEGRLAAFSRDIDQLDARLSEILSPVRGKEFFVFHPAFAYFAERYGLVEVPIEVSGKEPSARDVTRLVEKVRKIRARVIFVQVQFAHASALAIARETGTRLVDLDDLSGDYLRNLEDIARKVADALKDGGPASAQGRESG